MKIKYSVAYLPQYKKYIKSVSASAFKPDVPPNEMLYVLDEKKLTDDPLKAKHFKYGGHSIFHRSTLLNWFHQPLLDDCSFANYGTCCRHRVHIKASRAYSQQEKIILQKSKQLCEEHYDKIIRALKIEWKEITEDLKVGKDTPYPKLTFSDAKNPIQRFINVKFEVKTNKHCKICGMSVNMVPYIQFRQSSSICICGICTQKFLREQVDVLMKDYDPEWLKGFDEYVKQERFLHKL